MARRSSARLAAVAVVVLLLMCAGVPAALGSGEPQDSFLYQNFLRASDVLDRAVAAHGGTELLDRATNVRLAVVCSLRYEGHYARPWAHLDYRLPGRLIYSADHRALKSVFEDDSVATLVGFTIAGPANGLERGLGGSKPDSIPEKDRESRMREELEILPHEYLRQARAQAASLRLLPGSDDYDVLCYSLDDGQGRALFFARDTHLLMRVERIGHWKLKGDRLEWRTFAGYFDQGGIKVPRRTEAHTEGYSHQFDMVTEITGAEFGTPVNDSDLVVPVAYRTGFEDWTLQKPAAEEPLPVHDLGKGATIIQLPSITARSLLVAFSDFSVIVESGDHSEIAERLLATAERILPGKPVRYVAMTHHHPLYANGLRPYARRGITILATPGNVSYYRDLTMRPYRIHPDGQQRAPHEPKIEVIDKVRTIKDKTQRLDLYVFDYSTHTDEYVLPYLPSHKLIVTGDMVYVMRGEEVGPASRRERAIDRVVRERKLSVESIMQTWFVPEADDLVPYSVLEEKIRKADARDARAAKKP